MTILYNLLITEGDASFRNGDLHPLKAHIGETSTEKIIKESIKSLL